VDLGLADDHGVEQVEAAIEQEEAVEDGGRKAEHMPEVVGPARLAAQRPAQVGRRGPACTRHGQHEIEGYGVEQQARHPSTQSLRDPGDQPQREHIAALTLLAPDRRHLNPLPAAW
jgi:hypothetical protein